jgi:curved DNA-binding protein CbpA
MPGDGDADFYELLQISPRAEMETINRVDRLLVTRYHPDNRETGNLEKFVQLKQAYETLSDPSRRNSYDSQHEGRRLKPIRIFRLREFQEGIDGEPNRRMGILSLLYQRRRTDPDRAGITLLDLETLMTFPREHLMFTMWYLKEKGYVNRGDNSDFLITSEGVDYVESNLPKYNALNRLLKGVDAEEAEEPEDLPDWLRSTEAQ